MSSSRAVTGTRRQRRMLDQRGSTSMQMVLLLPALFAVMFLALQAALYSYATTVAGAAAQDGARAASAYDNRSTPDAGQAAAVAALTQSHGALEGWAVVTQDVADCASVTITGTALSVLPGLKFPVERTATFPWERLP